MKRNTKKGFTLVELVIVIAVIAILAGVLIPTFSNVVAKAQKSAEQQEVLNAWKECYALDMTDGALDGKEGDTDITHTKGTYSVNGSVATFTLSNGTYIASYNGTSFTNKQ